MRKGIVIIESENGSHKASIIRAISQILIGLRHTTVLNLGELGLINDIDTVVQLDSMKIGIASQNDLSSDTLQIVKVLADNKCDFIIYAVQNDPNDLPQLKAFTEKMDFNFLNLKSHSSDKLEVNYLIKEQVKKILLEVKRIYDLLGSNLR